MEVLVAVLAGLVWLLSVIWFLMATIPRRVRLVTIVLAATMAILGLTPGQPLLSRVALSLFFSGGMLAIAARHYVEGQIWTAVRHLVRRGR